MIVTIRYCQACGYRCRAAHLAAKIEQELHVAVEMQAGASGQFDVLIGGDVVATKRHPGFLKWILGDPGFPEEGAAIAAVKARLAQS